MMTNNYEHVKNLIRLYFNQFKRTLTDNYGIGDKELYDSDFKEIKDRDQYCLNPYLKTDDDVKVKFGGFCETEFIKKKLPYTIHSELHIYGNNRERADITIHKVDKNKLWLKKEDIMNSLLSAIEIKYENVVTPDYSINRGDIEKDVEKLSSLAEDVVKIMIIIDEGLKADVKLYNELTRFAKKSNVYILSNNNKLNTL